MNDNETNHDPRPHLLDIKEIEQLLNSPDTEIRLRAIKDLISLQDTSTIHLLEKAIQKETDVQNKYQLRKGINALKSLMALRGERTTNADFSQNMQKVENALQSENEEQINKAFRYIAQYRLKQFLPAMEKVCQAGTSYQKSMLINFLLSLGGEVNFNKIIPFLNDKDPRVIANAIEALEKIGNTRSLAYITQFAAHEHHRVQAAAMKALYNLGDQNALLLFEKMVHSPHEAYRSSAAYALKELKIPRSIELLKILAEDKADVVREKAQEALLLLDISKLSDTKIPPNKECLDLEKFTALKAEEKIVHIKSALEHKSITTGNSFRQYLEQETDHKVIASLIMAIALCQDSSHIETLKPFLKNSDGRIRANTVEALGLLLAKEQKDILIPCLEDDNNRVVGNAILALYEHFADLAEKALKNLSESTNRNEQLTAVFCIGAIGEDCFLSYSDYLAESSWTEVREKMLSVLEDLSQDSSAALRYLKQNRLKMALFHSGELNPVTPVSQPAKKTLNTTIRAASTKSADITEHTASAELTELADITEHTASAELTESADLTEHSTSAELTEPADITEHTASTELTEPADTAQSIKENKTITAKVKKPEAAIKGKKPPAFRYHRSIQAFADFLFEKLQIILPNLEAGYEVISLSLFLIALVFAGTILSVNLLIADPNLYYFWILKPLQFLFVSRLFFACFFYLLFPLILIAFILLNIHLLRQKKIFTGFLIGLSIFIYIPLLSALNLEYGNLLNFLGNDTARFFFSSHSSLTKLAAILLNFPWLLIPMLIEALITIPGFYRTIPIFLILLNILAALSAIQLNIYSGRQLNNQKWSELRKYYIVQKQQFEGLLNEANSREIRTRSQLGRAEEEHKKQFSSQLFNITEEQAKIKKELKNLQQQINYAESQIEF